MAKAVKRMEHDEYPKWVRNSDGDKVLCKNRADEDAATPKKKAVKKDEDKEDTIRASMDMTDEEFEAEIKKLSTPAKGK